MNKISFNYIGGKTKIADWIISHFPQNYTKMGYVEVFGGFAAVLLAKKPSKAEIYNDLNGELTNFFLVVKNKHEELQRELEKMPYSEIIFKQIQQDLITKKHFEYDEVERAKRFFYLYQNSRLGGGKAIYLSLKRNPINTFEKKINKLKLLAKRIKKVQISCKHWEPLIRIHDSPKTLFYVDPPYFGVNYYDTYNLVPPFDDEQHYKLAEVLNKVKGFVYLSYYYFQGIEELYPKDKWVYYKKNTKKGAITKDGKRPSATELLLVNRALQYRLVDF